MPHHRDPAVEQRVSAQDDPPAPGSVTSTRSPWQFAPPRTRARRWSTSPRSPACRPRTRRPLPRGRAGLRGGRQERRRRRRRGKRRRARPVPRAESAADPARPGQPDWDAVKVVVSPSWYDDYVLTVGSVDPHGRRRGSALPGRGWTSPRPARGSSRWTPTARVLIDTPPASAARGRFRERAMRHRWSAARRVGAVARAPADGETGDATHRGHRTPSAGRVGSCVGHGVVDALAAVSGRPSSRPPSELVT